MQRLSQLEQGRLVRTIALLRFYEFLGRFSQSLTRWPLSVRDRHGLVVQEFQLHQSKGLTRREKRRAIDAPFFPEHRKTVMRPSKARRLFE